MAGTREGGIKARETNLKKYGPDFYKKNGAKGGRNGQTGGFASDKIGADGLSGSERASIAGQTGGRISKRPPTHYVYYNGAKISLSAFAKKVGISYYVALKNYHAGEYQDAS